MRGGAGVADRGEIIFSEPDHDFGCVCLGPARRGIIGDESVVGDVGAGRVGIVAVGTG